MYAAIDEFVKKRRNEFDQIAPSRIPLLEQLAGYIQSSLEKHDSAALTCICTHNSRRSQLSQVWARVTAQSQGLTKIQTYSGGTTVTAFHPNAVKSLQRSGFVIHAVDPQVDNPVYNVHYCDNAAPIACFSKRFDHPQNPKVDFAAIMTCSEADQGCPLVPGCDLRIPLRYADPKIADGTDQEASVYDERSAEICREMIFVMSRI